jgi:hypothetical protein
MKKFVLAVGLLLLAVAASDAQQPTRKARQKSAKTGQRTQQRATAQAPTQAAPKGLPTAAKAAGKPRVAAKGPAGQPAPLTLKGLAPRSFAAAIPDIPPGSTTNPDGTITTPTGTIIQPDGTLDITHDQSALDQMFGKGKVPALPPDATRADQINQINAENNAIHDATPGSAPFIQIDPNTPVNLPGVDD